MLGASRVAIESAWMATDLRAFIRGNPEAPKPTGRELELDNGATCAWDIVEPGNDLEWTWHLDALCYHLEAVSRGEIRDLLITMPPRMLKSLIVAVFWPAWEWARDPTIKTVFGSYAQHLALRDAVKSRDIIRHPWFQRRWPLELAEDQNAKGYFKSAAGGHRFGTSVGAAATGEGGHRIVVDDPLNAIDAHSQTARDEARRWWREVMPSRLNNQRTGSRVVVMQRLHEEVLAELCIEAGYVHLNLPLEYDPARACRTWWVAPDGTEHIWADPRTEPGELIAPDRIGPEEAKKLADPAKGLGSFAFQAQYNQSPAPDDGSAMFPEKLEDGTPAWALWETLPRNPDGTLRTPDDALVAWDMTFKGKRKGKPTRAALQPDYVVGQLWYRYGAETFLIDEVRGQWAFGETKRQVRAFDERCRTVHPFAPSRHVIEDKANGPGLIDELRGVVGGVIGWSPDAYGDKLARAWHVQPRVEAMQVHLPKRAPWLSAWIGELRSFPTGKNDDRVDAFSMAHLSMFAARRWKAA